MKQTSIKSIIYWISTILVCVIFLYSAQMYIFNTQMVEGFFTSFNYPAYLVMPLAILKILGVIMVLWRKSKWLTEWAYAGFFFDVVLATVAHYIAQHGLFGMSFFTIFLVLISYFLGKEVRDKKLVV
ncbi:DoxX family protein [Olleya aquimaris]|uniref:DoxX family protein n=1 Tax=Olleya sediminilitoris TaxID=2795739 RepID=A0ABS1WGW9_9FLAO|nr:DoxX family protein [Olleya sediminilitoris]AXO80635.1 DoxX family protein [Olleya aquimaris]MBL7558370.1 DoxX family protein [Olleya sediminilitoris]